MAAARTETPETTPIDLDGFKEQLEARLEAIDTQVAPLQTEREGIVNVLDAMKTRRRRGGGRSSGSGNGRRKGGKRAEELLAIIQAAPDGISVKDAATKMDMKENYLYRVYPTLVEDGKVKKEGNLLVPTG